MLLFALLAPWAAQAQVELTVHDGTNTNNYVPIYGLWADAYLKCEMVYPATELAEMAGGTINSIMTKNIIFIISNRTTSIS